MNTDHMIADPRRRSTFLYVDRPRQSHHALWVLRGIAQFWLFCTLAASLCATDGPHGVAGSSSGNCSDCHMFHNAPGGSLLSVAGSVNLCVSCHVPGGAASLHPFANGDQALPWPGLPTNTLPQGTSHRWDSSAAGHITFLGGLSTGTIEPGGTYTGAYARTFTLTITNSGGSGTARFNWTTTQPGGGGTNLLTGTNIPLSEGISLTFRDGTNTPFQTGDQWRLYVRSDLRQPTNLVLLAGMTNGMVICTTCHDIHSQAHEPFDPSASPYSITASNRHYLVMDSDTDQMCIDCHGARNVTNALAGSHPVGVAIVTNAFYRRPSTFPLDKTAGEVRCSTCHQIHFSPAQDGSLARTTNLVSLCTDCHLLADKASPAIHFHGTNGVLWPGGQYGSTFPQITSPALRGSCDNCHQAHGWPNSTNTTAHYDKLLVDFEENVCFTCHDADGPAVRNVKDDFAAAKLRRHPIGDSDSLRRPGRSVECQDCHNPHKALVGAHVFTNTALPSRNLVSNPMKGASGVAVNYTGLGNFVAPGTNLYAVIPKSIGATNEYQVCFKCHTAYAFGSTPPAGLTPVYNTGTASFTTNSATVTGSGTSWGSGMVGLWIYRTNNPAAVYRITAVASTTSMTITPAYAGATVSGVGYAMSGGTDLAQEFSPMNKSGHPIVTGLSNYVNSTAVGSPSRKGLQPAALKAPWNLNVGVQTMMCSDCHNTDAASSAAQGPHGSATQFMLRGANAANWPNVTLANFGTSWCANCHNDSAGAGHTEGDHRTTSVRCYTCHIVVPHGGKISRLIADNNSTMPARYAYNNNLSNVGMSQFRKAATGSYTENNSCRTTCGHHSGGTGNEDW